MKLIKKTTENKIEINKSIFITTLFRVNNMDEVNNYLASTKKKYYDATHNCYAYIIGKNQEIQKCSDDGEPSKTAGAPMLDVLKKQELTNILAITTRYFGGTLLGAGGLIRAYSSSVSSALKDVDFYKIEELTIYKLTIPYNLYDQLLKSEYQIIKQDFLVDVILEIGVLQEKKESFIKYINDLSNGKAIPIECGIKEIETKLENK